MRRSFFLTTTTATTYLLLILMLGSSPRSNAALQLNHPPPPPSTKYSAVQYNSYNNANVVKKKNPSQEKRVTDVVEGDDNRRTMLQSMLHSGTFIFTTTAATQMIPPVSAAGATVKYSKNRTDGYKLQKTDKEWEEYLSKQQYHILREGGTERPNSSILEAEEREGIYQCAGCRTPLFDSASKFHSGTGWPSFASCIENGVEIEQVSAIQASLGGAELRCMTCGGHLGDVFNDGKLFINTPAFESGKRFCIDGAALVFLPANDKNIVVYGDEKPGPPKLPSLFDPPRISAGERV